MKRPRCGLLPRILISRLLLISCVFLFSVPGGFSSKTVTLGSIQFFNIHGFVSLDPIIYFYCKGENKIILPDVKEKHFFYTFKGKETWQPLTVLTDNKCKRCGLYEMEYTKSSYVFDEWELCLDDFVDGKSIHFKEKEFNATFICKECRAAAVVDPGMTSSSKSGSVSKKMNVVLVMVISALVSVMAAAGAVGAYRHWQKRKREQDRARFLRLFDEQDYIEDEVGLE